MTKQLEFVAQVVADLLNPIRGRDAMRANMVNSQAGVRSPNLQPHGGDRYEDIPDPTSPDGMLRVRVPSNDPTGEAALGVDEASQALARLDGLLRQLETACRGLAGLRDEWAPKEGASRPVDGPGEDWCSSCWRDGQHCEPVSGHHAGRCRWCGTWRSEHGEDPPLALLRMHHQGERITVQMAERYSRKKAS